ncbi:unnamed protein product [Lactuca virosa]|uniref:Uncharacterized protein n=1 Tax=Lactuca virosa TaxID=75947 RepID=A0AAU9NCS3_9ASTR|nr:unnamed protein product [Lactuca virosa]
MQHSNLRSLFLLLVIPRTRFPKFLHFLHLKGRSGIFEGSNTTPKRSHVDLTIKVSGSRKRKPSKVVDFGLENLGIEDALRKFSTISLPI